jgi:succinate dehydrogenase/fumarate reductase cytochrome b subunit
VQVISGLMVAWKKGFRKNGYDALQVLSGLYLSFFLFYHIRAVMLGRYVWNVETDFHFAAWGVKNTPADRFFIPYYSLSVLCVFIHLACVHRQKMLALRYTTDSSNQLVGRQAAVIVLTGVVVTVLIITAFINA